MTYVLCKMPRVGPPLCDAPETLPMGIGPYTPEWLGLSTYPDFQRWPGQIDEVAPTATNSGQGGGGILDRAPRIPRDATNNISVQTWGKGGSDAGTPRFKPGAVGGKHAFEFTTFSSIGAGQLLTRNIFRDRESGTLLAAFKYTVAAARTLFGFGSGVTNAARFNAALLANGGVRHFARRLDADTGVNVDSADHPRGINVWTTVALMTDWANNWIRVVRDETLMLDQAGGWTSGAGNTDTTRAVQTAIGQTEATGGNAGFEGQIAYIGARSPALNPTERMWWQRSVAARIGAPLL